MSDLKTQYGSTLSVGNMVIRHPTIRDMMEYGEDNAQSAMNLFMAKPSDLMVQLYDSGIDYTELTSYDAFMYSCSEISASDHFNEKSIVRDRLGWITGVYDFFIDTNEGTGDIFLLSKSSNAIIDKAVYIAIRKYLLDINFRSEKEKYNPGNEVTKKAIIDEERKKIKRESRKKHSNPLISQISSLVWGNSCGYKYDDVLDMPVYQFYDGIYRIAKIKNYDHVMSGYYSGGVTSKELKAIEDKIDWTSPIIT